MRDRYFSCEFEALLIEDAAANTYEEEEESQGRGMMAPNCTVHEHRSNLVDYAQYRKGGC